MPEGLKGWIEVFRAGRWTDSSGNTRAWTESDLDRMVAGYDPSEREAPAVIGHPQTNSPAYGWVESLKREGGRLLATFRQVEETFEKMVREGRFKKRSISVFPDGRLRHVGFLGAAAPAVPGLKDIGFEEGFSPFIEWSEEETDNQAGAGASVDPNKEMDMDAEELKKQLEEEKQKREAAETEVKEARKAAEMKAAEFAESEKKRKQGEVEAFVAGLVEKKVLLPARKEEFAALLLLCEECADREIEFSAGKRSAPGKTAREFLEKLLADPRPDGLETTMNRPKGDGEGDHAADEKAAQEIAGQWAPEKGN